MIMLTAPFFNRTTQPTRQKRRNMRRMINVLFILFPIVGSIFGGTIAHAAGELKSIVNRTSVSIEESLQLTVRYTGSQSDNKPDFSQLATQFDISNSSQNSQFQNYNGKITSFTDWTMTLFPKKEGKLLIPSFSLNGEYSDAVEITVTAPAKSPSGTLKDLFIETIVNKSSAYVQEQVIVTYRLYYAVNVDSLDNQPLEIKDVVVESLPNTRYSRKIDGKSYNVFEMAYALFPQTSGEIQIPALAWEIKVAPTQRRSFFGSGGRYERKRKRTKAKTIQVKPQPSNYPADAPWIIASNVTLKENWSQDIMQGITTGEPITRTLTLFAEGLLPSQLPPILDNNPKSAQLKTYADQPILNNDTTAKGIISQRIESAAMVASLPGQIVIPAVTMHWWDVATNSLKTLTIPEKTVTATRPEGEKGPLTSTAAPQENLNAKPQVSGPQTSGIWFWLSLFLLASNIFFLSLWWRLKYRRYEAESREQNLISDSEKQAFKKLKAACREENLPRIRQQLTVWAQLYFDDQSLNSLSNISRKLDHPALTQQILGLDSAIYSAKGDATIHGNTLLDLLVEWLKHHKASTKNEVGKLEGFYTQ